MNDLTEQKEDQALIIAMEKGRLEGRATDDQVIDFKLWLKESAGASM